MQRLEVSGAIRPLYGSLGVRGLKLGCSLPCCVRHGVGQVAGQPAEGLGYCSRSVPEVPVVSIRWVPGVPLTGIKQ